MNILPILKALAEVATMVVPLFKRKHKKYKNKLTKNMEGQTQLKLQDLKIGDYFTCGIIQEVSRVETKKGSRIACKGVTTGSLHHIYPGTYVTKVDFQLADR